MRNIVDKQINQIEFAPVVPRQQAPVRVSSLYLESVSGTMPDRY